MTFGERLRKIRERRGYSLSELAEKVGITKQAINQYEMNITGPKHTVLAALAVALDCTTDYLCGLKEEQD